MISKDVVKVAAIVVTYDSFKSITNNLDALIKQSAKLNQIYVVNNGEEKEIGLYIKSMALRSLQVVYVKTKYNMGGAGGFYEGLRLAIQSNNEWFWLMDDDCLPDKYCLENLLLHVKSKKYAYEPLVYDILSRSTIIYDKSRRPNSGIPEVKIHTFNGLLVSKELVSQIGLPRRDFFIYWDDIEYCLRINRVGGKVFLNTYAKMFHPNKIQEKKLFFLNFNNYDFNRLHVYYATRNKIILNNWYGGFELEAKEIIRRLILYCVTFRFDLLKLYLKAIVHGVNNETPQL